MTRGRHPTIADIAAKAGVAPMTVSRVINGSNVVSPGLRGRVEAAIRELDYSPNRLARGLKRQRTNVIGILLPDVSNPYSGELTAGIQSVLLDRGFSFFVATTDRSAGREVAALKAFFDHRMDGIVLATRPSQKGDEEIARFLARHYPMVAIGRDVVSGTIDRVSCRNHEGAFAAVEHLAALGHRRIAFLGVAYEQGFKLERFQGYVKALAHFGIGLEPRLVIGPGAADSPGFSTQVDGYQGTRVLLGLEEKPTAIFARNDFTAFGALRAARDLGFAVPDDLSIVGFDDVPLAAFTAPPLTTVAQPIAEQGRCAAELLLERIEGVEGERREILFDCELMVRDTTGPCRDVHVS